MSTMEDSPTGNGTNNALKPANPQNLNELTFYIQTMMQQMQDRFQTMSDQIINRIDDMGKRIDGLEKNVADLMTQTGEAHH